MKKTAILLIALGASPVYAHDFLFEVLVYSEDYDSDLYHLVVNYDLDEQDLVSELESKPGDGNVCTLKSGNQLKTCGVFDHFDQARSVAINTCDNYASANASLYPNGLIPLYVGPASFTDGVAATEDHHANYQYNHGLNFYCVEIAARPIKQPIYQELNKKSP